ncbi:MAG: hypothetical protein ACLVJ6_14160 [Merdibacter sp.]
MAVWFQGMTMLETFVFMRAMIRSGKRWISAASRALLVTSIPAAASGQDDARAGLLVSARGAAVAKMSGRGLGHTGGTITS